MRKGLLAELKRRGQHQLNIVIPHGGWIGGGLTMVLIARIINEHIDAAVFLHYLVYEIAAISGHRQIAGDIVASQIIRIIAFSDNNNGMLLFYKRFCECATYSLSSACDNYY